MFSEKLDASIKSVLHIKWLQKHIELENIIEWGPGIIS